jgi:hypothetical protein
MEENQDGIYDKAEGRDWELVEDLGKLPFTDEEDKEILVYNSKGQEIPRMEPVENVATGECGVLMDLSNIQALFSSGLRRQVMYDDDPSSSDDDAAMWQQKEATKVEGYPLGFLRTVGNVQATGAPHCLYPTLGKINKCVRKVGDRASDGTDESPGSEESEGAKVSMGPVVKATSSQFYNLVAHRVVPRAGRLDSQRALVTAALSGAFVRSTKDKTTAKKKRRACDADLPSARFHQRIHLPNCPKACRAEVVYTVDVRNLKTQTGRYDGHSFPLHQLLKT